MNVTIELADLCEIHQSAKLYDFMKNKSEEAEKKIAVLEIDCERQAKEINGLRCELSTRPTTRELQPVTRTAISNAKDVLDRLFRVVPSEDLLCKETVPADEYHAVYNALRDLVKQLDQEGMA